MFKDKKKKKNWQKSHRQQNKNHLSERAMDLTAHQSVIQSYFKQIIMIALIYIARSFTYSTIPV